MAEYVNPPCKYCGCRLPSFPRELEMCARCEALSKFWWEECWDGDDYGIARDDIVEMCRDVLNWREGVDDGVSVGVAKACHAFLVRVGLGEFT